MGLGTHPFAMPARVNGGVLRMNASWRSPTGRGTPNRCVSASRPVGPSSIYRRGESPLQGDLPPPRAQENVAEKAQPRSRSSAEMGRSTDADGERECAETSPPLPLHRPLDKHCFIDGPSIPMYVGMGGGIPMYVGNRSPNTHPPRWALPPNADTVRAGGGACAAARTLTPIAQRSAPSDHPRRSRLRRPVRP